MKRVQQAALIVAASIAVSVTSIPAFAQKSGNAKRGRIVFAQCASCHNADSAARKAGPSLKGLFAKDKLQSDGKPATVANVVNKIKEGSLGMPSYKDKLSGPQLADLLAYLKTL